MRKRLWFWLPLFMAICCLGAVLVYNLPPVNERLSWRLANLWVGIRRAINPPEQLVFVPEGGGDNPGLVETNAKATLQSLSSPTAPSSPADSTPLGMETSAMPQPSETPLPTETATPTWTAIPGSVTLSGIRHEYQQFNNCGPANLSMALSFWGWQGNQNDTRAFLRPNRQIDDKNVMPAEMVAFVEGFTELRAVTRLSGDVELLKRFIAAGFPVMIEKGIHPSDDWWMGHFLMLNGYDDARGRFTSQDSLIAPDLPVNYEDMSERWWRDFNYVYLVVYPLEREGEVLGMLGPQADETYNYQQAAQRAQEEIPNLEGRDLFFAWFNLGSSLTLLEDYAGAAEAFDQAFAVYATLSEEMRPYRAMWYRVEPYPAYYHTGRYQDVINLANTTFTWVSQPVLEESYYWRGLAYEALGNVQQAISDLTKAFNINPNFTAAREALERLGVDVP